MKIRPHDYYSFEFYLNNGYPAIEDNLRNVAYEDIPNILKILEAAQKEPGKVIIL